MAGNSTRHVFLLNHQREASCVRDHTIAGLGGNYHVIAARRRTSVAATSATTTSSSARGTSKSDATQDESQSSLETLSPQWNTNEKGYSEENSSAGPFEAM